MIENLSLYFEPEQEIFLDSISYNKIEGLDAAVKDNISLLCMDNLNVSYNEDKVRVIISRSLKFEPESLFALSISYGAILKIRKGQKDLDFGSLNLAEEFKENGAFVTSHLMSRISLLIGQITASFGQAPIILPPELVKDLSK